MEDADATKCDATTGKKTVIKGKVGGFMHFRERQNCLQKIN